jgi:hypothetical protein
MTYELAQVNVARLRAPLDSPVLGGFVAVVDPIGRLAEQSPGFVWRLVAGEGHGVVTRVDQDAVLVVNVSVWRSYEALHAFAYRSAHGALVRRRTEWFLPVCQPSTALWWVSAGHRPDAEDALRHLALLRRYGPSSTSFSLRQRFTPDGQPVRPRAGRTRWSPNRQSW